MLSPGVGEARFTKREEASYTAVGRICPRQVVISTGAAVRNAGQGIVERSRRSIPVHADTRCSTQALSRKPHFASPILAQVLPAVDSYSSIKKIFFLYIQNL